jgi:precorrin-8X/cobalt-precorrin-8 methylmutase
MSMFKNSHLDTESYQYETAPQAIEDQSFKLIRKLSDLSMFDFTQQQVVMRIIHSLGLPEIASHVRFSNNACEAGITALRGGCPILCDVEMVKQGVTKRMIDVEPLCYLNHENTAALAKEKGETRSMAALELWKKQLKGSVVIIGNAPTALFRLLEMIEKDLNDGVDNKPALIIGMPVGFVGAAESKDALWQVHEQLGIECITILGRQGGSAVSSASCNALLRVIRGEMY